MQMQTTVSTSTSASSSTFPLSGNAFVQSQQEISFIKKQFTEELSHRLNLREIEAPLFVQKGDGVQDDLNGVERPVAFAIKTIPGPTFEVVQSLAKWKRAILGRWKVQQGEGIITHMRALRPDEEILDQVHSVLVDQWDWEKVISPQQRQVSILQDHVQKIYAAMLQVEQRVQSEFGYRAFLPPQIHFIHTEDLYYMYPHLLPKDRERMVVEKYGAVFLIGIGGKLPDGTIHDGRAPDYDDWSTLCSESGRPGLNGDILVWHPTLKDAFEVSSMGIRVDAESLQRQLQERSLQQRQFLPWHQDLLLGQLPQTIGGGIGQSRLCMLLLQKKHIGEVQFSIWP